MPDIQNAILGVSSLHRKREKLSREAADTISALPNWMKNWTYEQGESYLNTLDFSDPDIIKATFQKVWQMNVILRDHLKLYYEET